MPVVYTAEVLFIWFILLIFMIYIGKTAEVLCRYFLIYTAVHKNTPLNFSLFF